MAIRKRENKKMKKIWGSQENGGRGRAKSLCAASVNAMRLLCEWSRAGISAKGKGKATSICVFLLEVLGECYGS